MSGTGDFGKLVDDYELGRKPYPEMLMRYIDSLIGEGRVLDLACGTGKATRRLAKPIVGVDPDFRCIEKARSLGGEGIEYVVGSAQQLLFPDEWFRVITTFCAFHWYWNLPGVLDQIWRVLESKGVFVVVNKDDTGDFRRQVVSIVERFSDEPISASVKQEYNPVKFLEDDGRFEVCAMEWEHTDVFTPKELVHQIRSMAPWNAVPPDRRAEASQVMMGHFLLQMAEDGFHRPLKIRLVLATKL